MTIALTIRPRRELRPGGHAAGRRHGGAVRPTGLLVLVPVRLADAVPAAERDGLLEHAPQYIIAAVVQRAGIRVVANARGVGAVPRQGVAGSEVALRLLLADDGGVVLDALPGSGVAGEDAVAHVGVVANLGSIYAQVLGISGRVARVGRAGQAVIAIDGGGGLDALAGGLVAGEDAVADVAVVANLGSVDAQVPYIPGRVARVDRAGETVVAVDRRRALDARVGGQIAGPLAEAGVVNLVRAVRVARAPERQLLLPPGGHVAQRLAVGEVGEPPPRADASPRPQELEGGAGVHRAVTVEDVPAGLVPRVDGGGGRLARPVQHGVAYLVVGAPGKVGPEEGGDAGDVGGGHGAR